MPGKAAAGKFPDLGSGIRHPPVLGQLPAGNGAVIPRRQDSLPAGVEFHNQAAAAGAPVDAIITHPIKDCPAFHGAVLGKGCLFFPADGIVFDFNRSQRPAVPMKRGSPDLPSLFIIGVFRIAGQGSGILCRQQLIQLFLNGRVTGFVPSALQRIQRFGEITLPQIGVGQPQIGLRPLGVDSDGGFKGNDGLLIAAVGEIPDAQIILLLPCGAACRVSAAGRQQQEGAQHQSQKFSHVPFPFRIVD